MKTSYPSNWWIVASAITVFAVSPAVVATDLAPTSTLQVQSVGGNTARVTVVNAADQVWVIQRSDDLVNWSEVGAWKVHNGSFHSTFAPDASNPNLFFRAFYDSSRQNILSTTAN